MSQAVMELTAASRGVERESLLIAEQRGAPETDYDETPLAAAEALARTPFFMGLSRVDLARLVPELEELRYAAGETVFQQGDPPDGLYLIRRGEARVLADNGESGATVLASLGPSEYFGEMGLVSQEPRSATVEAITPLEVWRLPSESFRELVASQPSLPLQIAAALSRRLAATDRQLSRKHAVIAAPEHYLEGSQGITTTLAGEPAGGRGESAITPPVATLPKAKRSADKTGAEHPSRVKLALGALGKLPWARALISAVVFGTLLGAWFSPPPPGMTTAAFRAILLVIASLATSSLGLLPDFLTFLLMVAVWAAAGIVPARVAASGFASPTWLLLLATMAIGVGLARSGLLYRVALEILGRVPARYPVLAGCLAGLGVMLSPGMPSVVGRVSLLGPIAQDIAESLRHPPRSNGTAGLALASLLGAGMMGTLFLTGSPMALVLYGLLPPDARAEVSFVNWSLAALPFHLVMFLGTLAFIVRRYRPSGQPPSSKTLRVQRALLGRVNRGEWLALGVFIMLVVGFSSQPIHGIDPAWVALFGVAAMFAGRLIDAEALRRGVNWQLLLYLGVILSLGEVLRAVEFDAWLSGLLVPALSGSGLQPGLLIVGVGLLAVAVSLVIGMIPAILVLALALLPVAAQLGISPWLVAMIIITGANQWLYPQQNVVYVSLHEATQQRAFSHAQARPAAFVFAAMTILGLVVSVPYWQALGLLH